MLSPGAGIDSAWSPLVVRRLDRFVQREVGGSKKTKRIAIVPSLDERRFVFRDDRFRRGCNAAVSATGSRRSTVPLLARAFREQTLVAKRGQRRNHPLELLDAGFERGRGVGRGGDGNCRKPVDRIACPTWALNRHNGRRPGDVSGSRPRSWPCVRSWRCARHVADRRADRVRASVPATSAPVRHAAGRRPNLPVTTPHTVPPARSRGSRVVLGSRVDQLDRAGSTSPTSCSDSSTACRTGASSGFAATVATAPRGRCSSVIATTSCSTATARRCSRRSAARRIAAQWWIKDGSDDRVPRPESARRESEGRHVRRRVQRRSRKRSTASGSKVSTAPSSTTFR